MRYTWVLLLLIPSLLSGQTTRSPLTAEVPNLIPNSSFEDINTCIKYNEPCQPSAWRSATLTNFTYHQAEESNAAFFPVQRGERCATLPIFHSKQMENRLFLQTALLCPLVKGELYEFSMYVRVGDVAPQQLSVFFTDTLQVLENYETLKNIRPQLNFKIDQNWKPRTWQKVKAEYVARGNEIGLLIGNFDFETP